MSLLKSFNIIRRPLNGVIRSHPECQPSLIQSALVNDTIFRTCTTQSAQIAELMSKLTGCSTTQAINILHKRYRKGEFEEEKVIGAYHFLKQKGIENDNIARYVGVILTHPWTLENQYLVLEELGFRTEKINCSTLSRFYKLVNTDISKLKRLNLIDKDTDVRLNCLISANLNNYNTKSKTSEDVSAISVHKEILDEFIKAKANEESNLPIHRRLRYKSLRNIHRTYELLTKTFQLSNQRILNYLPILCISPSNLEGILEKTPYLAGRKVQEIVNIWPKLVFNNPSSLKKIDEHLKEFNISEEAILKTASVYTLNPDNVYNRLQVLRNNSQLNNWSYHPQVLRTVLYQHKALKRLTEFKQHKMKCVTIFSLQCQDSLLEHRMDGLDRSWGFDVVMLVKLKLSADKKYVRESFKRHPYWLYIPMLTVKETLEFLMEKGFTREQILSNLILLLYPKSAVERELSRVHTMDGIECCKINNKLREDTILPLVLYNLEQPSHFSADAVWSFNDETVREHQ